MADTSTSVYESITGLCIDTTACTVVALDNEYNISTKMRRGVAETLSRPTHQLTASHWHARCVAEVATAMHHQGGHDAYVGMIGLGCVRPGELALIAESSHLHLAAVAMTLVIVVVGAKPVVNLGALSRGICSGLAFRRGRTEQHR